jgi:hypothetical protein
MFFISDPDPGSGFRIRILIFLPIPDLGGQKGTGSRIRIRNTDFLIFFMLKILENIRSHL